jgi:hypothetical protein
LRLVAFLATAQPERARPALGWEVADVDAGGASVAWFRDPDGNILSLTERP